LSACNTGLGKITKGDELIGLTRAFIFAGSPSIMGTFWSVNDESTSIFMKSFYMQLQKMDKIAALQSAQRMMIGSDRFSHPYYWAAFQMIGDYK
jgi:CHAT domain-containing protein